MVNILARILDSEQNFNGSADPMITADRGFIQFWGADFGFCLLGSSSLFFLLASARFCFDTEVGYIIPCEQMRFEDGRTSARRVVT